MTRLQEIQDRLTRARDTGELEQPWTVVPPEGYDHLGGFSESYGVAGPDSSEEIAELIAHAPDDIQHLLDELERSTNEMAAHAAHRVTLHDAPALQRLMDGLNDSGNLCDFPVMGGDGVTYLAFGEDRSGGGEEMFCWLQPADAGSPDFHPMPGYDQCKYCGQHWAVRFALDHARYPVTAWLNTEQSASIFAAA